MASTFNQGGIELADVNYSQIGVIREVAPSRAFSNNFDYCMVFPLIGTKHEQQKGATKFVLQALIDSNFEIFLYKSIQGDELICLFRANDDMLCEFADKINYKMLLDPQKAKTKLEAGNNEKEIKPHAINEGTKFSRLFPYDYIWARFEDSKRGLFYTSHDTDFVFSELNRLRLIYYILKAPKRLGGCALELMELLKKEEILSMYPLHNKEENNAILDNCLDKYTFPWQFPFPAIRNYFGEKVCLYFHFMGHYSQFLIIPGIVGLAFQVVVWYYGDYSHPVLPFFSVLISLWAIVMLEMWKRKQSYVDLLYGMLDFEEDEPDRPEFEGELIPSFIDGNPMIYFDPGSASERAAQSYSVIVSFILMVVGVVTAIYILRWSMQKRAEEAPYASTVASILNSAQITIFNMIYLKLASHLTKLENHRTDTQYEDNLIVKIFSFTFVNSFASFFYLAFVAGFLTQIDAEKEIHPDYRGQCGWTDCMRPLMINLAIIFGVRLVVTNSLDILLPYYNKIMKQKSETKSDKGEQISLDLLTAAEQDYVLQEYDLLTDNIANLSDTVVQYGYMTLFITALPISCIITFFCNYLKMKLHAWRLLSMYQRPIPVGAQDLGSWQSIFTLMSVIAVATNAGLIVFTMDLANNEVFAKRVTINGKYWIFIAFQWVLIGIQFMISVAIPDEPNEVTIQKKRATFIIDKIIDETPDEDFHEPDYDPYGLKDKKIETFDPADPAGCCKKCKKSFKKKKAKNADGEKLADFPIKEYPISEEILDWPASMSKANLEAHLSNNATKIVKSSTSYKKHRSMVADDPTSMRDSIKAPKPNKVPSGPKRISESS